MQSADVFRRDGHAVAIVNGGELFRVQASLTTRYGVEHVFGLLVEVVLRRRQDVGGFGLPLRGLSLVEVLSHVHLPQALLVGLWRFHRFNIKMLQALGCHLAEFKTTKPPRLFTEAFSGAKSHCPSVKNSEKLFFVLIDKLDPQHPVLEMHMSDMPEAYGQA